MGVGLIQQTKAIVLPFGRIHRLGVRVIRDGFLVFPKKPIDFPPHYKCDWFRLELDHFVQVIQRALRLTQVHPGEMSIEVSV